MSLARSLINPLFRSIRTFYTFDSALRVDSLAGRVQTDTRTATPNDGQFISINAIRLAGPRALYDSSAPLHALKDMRTRLEAASMRKSSRSRLSAWMGVLGRKIAPTPNGSGCALECICRREGRLIRWALNAYYDPDPTRRGRK